MQVYCIFGDERVMRSKSPSIFSAVLERLGIKGQYVPFKIAPGHIAEALESMKVLNISGANIAIPYKEDVISYLDILSEGANIIGSVNTVVRNGDILKGYNTIAIGFMDALNHARYDVEGKSALVLGTGGAARAIVFILNWLRTKTVFVAGRDPEKTGKIVDRFGGKAIPFYDLENKPLAVNIAVNATSVSSSDESPEMASLLESLEVKGCELVLDLNYNRSDNFWQDLARRNRAQFMDGLSTLAYQCRRTLALWTGIQAPPDEFLKAINQQTH
jgi:shikimate dehydrogenase